MVIAMILLSGYDLSGTEKATDVNAVICSSIISRISQSKAGLIGVLGAWSKALQFNVLFYDFYQFCSTVTNY